MEEGAVIDKAIIGENCLIKKNSVFKKTDGSVAVLGRKGVWSEEKARAKEGMR